ncbi:cytochrome C, partial [Methylococcaceae bacterium HT4]
MKTLKTSILFSLVLAISIFALYGCNTNITEKEIRSSDEGYHYITFKQGWTKNEAMDFYNTSQGSQFIPYSWFLAIEQPEHAKPFRDNENIRRFGYIPQQKTQGINPDGLPIGFVKDIGSESFLSALANSRYASNTQGLHSEYKEWLGLTYAACHTSEVRYNNQTFRIEGGPSFAASHGERTR